jgi:hypothetical protein
MNTRHLPLIVLGVLFATAGTATAGSVTGTTVSAATIYAGATVSVTVTGTNPCGAAHINYGDGVAITYAITGLPTTQTHTYEKTGTFTITARGMGNCDGEASTTVSVSAPPAPAAGAQITAVEMAPTPGRVREPVTITVNGTGTCAYEVHYGDGNAQEVNGRLPQQFRHTYAKVASYTVIVKPNPPCTGKFTQVLQVVDAATQVSRLTRIVVTPSPAAAGQPVFITVEGSGSCRYSIDFGDGNSDTRSAALPERVRHVYPAPGSYAITASSETPCAGTARTRFDVRNAVRLGVERIEVTPTPAIEGSPATFVLRGTGNCRATIEFGDGTTQSFSGTLPRRVRHTYATAGKYTVAAWADEPCSGDVSIDLEVTGRRH